MVICPSMGTSDRQFDLRRIWPPRTSSCDYFTASAGAGHAALVPEVICGQAHKVENIYIGLPKWTESDRFHVVAAVVEEAFCTSTRRLWPDRSASALACFDARTAAVCTAHSLVTAHLSQPRVVCCGRCMGLAPPLAAAAMAAIVAAAAAAVAAAVADAVAANALPPPLPPPLPLP